MRTLEDIISDIKKLTMEEIEDLEEQGYEFVSLRSLKQGDLFQLVPAGPIFVRGSYDRSIRKYNVYFHKDVNRDFFLDGSQLVF